MSRTEHQRKTQKAINQGSDDKGKDVFNSHTDHILGLDKTYFIANKTCLHKEYKTGADDDPEMINTHV